MMHRFFVSMSLVCSFGLLSCEGAWAQQTAPEYGYVTVARAGLADLSARLDRDFTPVRVWRIEGPDVLTAGEEALFVAHANIESASVPLHARWQWGDGTTSRGFSARHRFDTPGSYTVTFTASNRESEEVRTWTVRVVGPGEATGTTQGDTR